MSAKFVASAPRCDILPKVGLPEIAFSGRSNVGKSSLISLLTGQAKLVRISKTPGRTQQLNLFNVDNRWSFVDLPGYGYAKLSKSQRRQMEQMVHGYLAQREELNGVVLALDARREEPSDEDHRMFQMVLNANRSVLIVLTKMDLIPKNRRVNQRKRIETALGIPSGAAMMCSAKSGDGRAELLARLKEFLG